MSKRTYILTGVIIFAIVCFGLRWRFDYVWASSAFIGFVVTALAAFSMLVFEGHRNRDERKWKYAGIVIFALMLATSVFAWWAVETMWDGYQF